LSGTFKPDKADIYSFAILVLELFSQEEPYSTGTYSKMTLFSLQEFVKSGQRLPIPTTFPKDISYLISRCWDNKPDLRPNFVEITSIITEYFVTLPIPVPPDQKNLAVDYPIPKLSGRELREIGWSGNISKQEAEQILQSWPPQTFLTRWSNNANSFVLSLVTMDTKDRFLHIGNIFPVPEEQDTNLKSIVKVLDATETYTKYDNLKAFIQTYIKNGTIKRPHTLPLNNLYNQSPSLYGQVLDLEPGKPKNFYMTSPNIS